jgi:oligopeptidase B
LISEKVDRFNPPRQARHFSHPGDPYQFFREPSAKLWNRMGEQNERTLQAIDSSLRMELESDIQTLVARAPESVPEYGPSGNFLYTTSSGLDGRLRYSRTRSSLNADDEAEAEEILELNLHEYELKAMSLSVDETFLAYITSTTVANPGESQLWSKDLGTGKTVQVPTANIQRLGFVEWGPMQENGSHSLFFTSTDAWNRPDSVWACLATGISEPVQIYHNSDETVLVDVQRTKGCRYLAISASTKTTNEVYLVSELSQPPVLVRARQAGLQYHLDVGANGDVYLLVNSQDDLNNDSNEQLMLFRSSVDSLPLKSNSSDFGTFIAGSTDEYVIADIDIFRDALVLYERSTIDGSQRIRIKGSNGDHSINIAQQMNPSGNMWYDAPSVQFTVESPVTGPLTHEYNFETETRSALQSSISPEEEAYAHSRLLVPSHDGVQVPLTLIHRKDVDPFQRKNLVVLVGYGAYGEPVIQGYDPTSAAPLVDRGVVLAYAHTRGGGDLGRAWYNGGRLYNKVNAIEDYRACAESLVDSIVDPAMLTAKAFSAGGVTVGAAVNRSPELFGSVVLVNAFLDVTTSMMNKMALTEHEYDEWGDPTVDQKAAELIASYCPMTNLRTDQTYPHMLIVGTLDDPNVPYWHALSFHAKLADPDRHLVYMVPQGGHHMYGSSLDVAALTNAFILEQSSS